MHKEETTIRAAYDAEFDQILKNLRVGDETGNIQLKCFFCNDQVTPDRIYSVFPFKGRVTVSCDRLSCVENLSHLAIA
jgi:hypothetical protein